MDEREQIEARLRILHSDLDASSCDFGDWRMSKAFENLLEDMSTATEEELPSKLLSWFQNVYEDLSLVIEQRKANREEINELEGQLNGAVGNSESE